MKLVLGSRGSSLALRQTDLVASALRAVMPEIEIDIREIVTTGDRKQGTPDAAVSDKKEWIAELENALVAAEIDLAVHSAKDVPIDIVGGTTLISVLKRSSPYEALVLHSAHGMPAAASLESLPKSARIGTASLRRQAQIRWSRPDVELIPVRGNVPTRVRKLSEEKLDGIVLAAAGLERLSLVSPQVVFLSAREMLPAVNQGILVVQLRTSDTESVALLQQLRDTSTAAAFEAERAVIECIGADCRSAVGVHASVEGERLQIRAEVYHRSERRRIERELTGRVVEAASLGRQLGDELLALGAKDLL